MRAFSCISGRMFVAIVLAMFVALSLGCAGKPPYEMDRHFSINIVKPCFTEKHIRKFTQVESAIYNKYGPPDWMRILWTPDGELSSRRKQFMRVIYKKDRESEHAWIYLERGKEIRFKGDLDYELHDIDDRIRLVCKIGDPESTRRDDLGSETYCDIWEYHTRGERYYISMHGAITRLQRYDKIADVGIRE